MFRKIMLMAFATTMFLSLAAEAAAANPFADVPKGHWAYASLMRLEQDHVLPGGKDYDGNKIITRYEMAQLVGAALAHKNEYSSYSQQNILPSLSAEFAEELNNLGVRIAKLEAGDGNVNFNGQIRWHYVDNYRSRHDSDDNHQLRLRLYINGKVNETWDYHAMLENKQDFHTNAEEGKTAFERAYVTGPLGILRVTGGAFSSLMAEGNIYDTSFDGIRFEFGDVIKYSLLYGEADIERDNKMFVATASYKDYDYDAAIGYHHLNYDQGTPKDNTIWSAGGNYDFGNYSLGAMYLHASEKDAKGDRDGYVLTFKHGRVKSWKADTYEIYTKYYEQPVHTYLAHTMTGLAGYMDGFKGYCVGAQYALGENIVLGIEYYDLRDKITDEKNRTIWTQMIFDFKID